MSKRQLITLLALSLIVFSLFAGALPGQAQEALTFQEVEVSLWPEYDDPAMLVIYHITLPSATPLPAEISLRIPARAGEPNAVASRQPDDTLLTTPYERTVEGDWAVLTFNATAVRMQVEYYDPGLEKDGESRSFTFTWPGDYAVDSLVLQVQHPFGASNMVLSPRLGSTTTGSDGLTYSSSDFGAVPAGETVQVEMSYQKASDALSASQVSVQPGGAVNEDTPGRTSPTFMVPWIVGGLGLLLVAGALIWYWQSGAGKQKEPAGAHRKRRSRAATPAGPEVSEAPESGKIYCHNCGKRAGPNDRFCRACGTQLRLG